MKNTKKSRTKSQKEATQRTSFSDNFVDITTNKKRYIDISKKLFIKI